MWLWLVEFRCVIVGLVFWKGEGSYWMHGSESESNREVQTSALPLYCPALPGLCLYHRSCAPFASYLLVLVSAQERHRHRRTMSLVAGPEIPLIHPRLSVAGHALPPFCLSCASHPRGKYGTIAVSSILHSPSHVWWRLSFPLKPLAGVRRRQRSSERGVPSLQNPDPSRVPPVGPRRYRITVSVPPHCTVSAKELTV